MAADSDIGAEALPNEVVVTEILARLPAKSVGHFFFFQKRTLHVLR
jgi:hypothetical protein